MKKFISFFLSIIILSASSFATAKSGENWYFSSRGKNERPGLPTLDQSLGKGIGKDEKVLYLTFDAGYENGNVAKVVKTLQEEKVTGAFFVLKHFIQDNPELCKQIRQDGHLLCNHTANHPNITTLSPAELEQELNELEQVCKQVCGKGTDPYFRPPEGAYSKESLAEVARLGYRTVFWSLAWADWDNNNQKSPEYAMEKLCSRVHNGAVILLHPTSATNAQILGDFIREMKSRGYRFGSVEELWQG